MTDNGSKKTAMRKALQARRREMGKELRAAASLKACKRLLRHIDLTDINTIALFWPLGTEIDPRPLCHSLYQLGLSVALPKTHARAQPLSFHSWTPETVLKQSQFGVAEPTDDEPSPVPEVMIIPLLGFDRSCFRLGYGAGHYDCTLSALTAQGHQPKTIGLAFSCQEVPEVPREDHDVPLDMIVTEEDAFQRLPCDGA